ncbi:MAG TPA: carboxypeptidase-like regulatory domain-containing protein, partial [Candidatus Rubrimentiphilum sp.]|nr:carboxypeptidase-like regulatory domain-containing protein [Candidatus Rubrimentiphilum sp.]
MSSFHGKQSARTILRLSVALLISGFLLVQSCAPAFAGTTGILAGTVTDSATSAPLANVQVTAVAPTGRATATTNSRGFFSMAGLSPDTYSVSFTIAGYEPVSVPGQNVFADLTTTVSTTLVKSLKTIVHVTSRSMGGAFQPNQTVNTYNVTQHQVQTILGTSLNLAESTLITSLPGGSLDSSGYPVIRGGRENEENFEFEGIPFTDAFTNQFTNSLSVPGLGLQSAQLTPGLGNASQDNYGTGTFNLIAKRGAYPGFATGLFGIGSPAFQHIANAEWGFASPNGRISAYMALSDNNQNSAFNTLSMNCLLIGTCFSRYYQTKREFLGNLVYKFGHNNNQALQFFTDIGQSNFYTGFNFGQGNNLLCYATCDPFTLQQMVGLAGLAAPSLTGAPGLCPTALTCTGYTLNPTLNVTTIQSLIQLYPQQSQLNQTLGSTNERPQINYQPNAAFKLGYIWNINSSSVLEAMAYHLDAVTTFDLPLAGGYASFNSARRQLQGGRTSGYKLDYTRQLSDKNLFKAGGEYKYLVPVFDAPANDLGVIDLEFEHGEQKDFLTAAQCTAVGLSGCGYIYTNGVSNVTSPQTVPRAYENTSVERHDWAAYIDDTWSPNDKLKIEGGLRFDGASFGYPNAAIDPYTCTSVFLPTYSTNANGVLLTTPSTNPNANTIYTNPITGLTSTTATDPGGHLGLCPVATFPQLTNQSRRPVVPEPIFSATYRLGANDSIRASYGRSINLPTLGLVDFSANMDYFGGPNRQFFAIPSNLGAGGFACGALGDQICANYAEQLYWDNAREFAGGVPLMPVRPTVFTNIDFSWEHQFTRGWLNGISFKLTPWYRKAFDETALVSTPKFVGGVPLLNPITGAQLFNPSTANNLGKNQADGIELQFTKEQTYGLSGQVSFTYQNELSSVIPGSSSEDFYPSIPAQSVLLGNIYRVGFLSPFVASFDFSYETHNGWRISPQTQWNIGYPIGPGFITSAFINGQPFNIPFTNACPACSTTGTGQYVDPMNPGSFFKPNVA